MAFLTEIFTGLGTPQIRTNPKDGDIVINGVAYDPASMMPKVGKNEVWVFDHSATVGSIVHTFFDADGVGKMTPGLSNNFENYTAISTNGPSVKRSIASDRSMVADTWKEAGSFRYDKFGRDWLEHPPKMHFFDESNDMYYVHYFYQVNVGGSYYYRGTSGEPHGLEQSYGVAAAYNNPGVIWDVNDSGLIGCARNSTTTVQSDILTSIPYSANALLETTTRNALLNDGSTTSFSDIIYMGKMDNGDLVFVNQYGYNYYDIGRVENATNSVTFDFTNVWASAANGIHTIPSNVVRHNESGETNTNKKIFYMSQANNTSNWQSNTKFLIEMDTAQGTISKTTCSQTNGSGVGNINDSYTDLGGSSTTFDNVFFDNRILRASQAIDSQKWLMQFVSHNSDDSIYSLSSTNQCPVLVWEISTSASETLICRYAQPWTTLLTQSSRNTNANGFDRVPWCVAPLNPEHTLMLCFCTFSTHLIKLDTTTGSGGGTLSEVWYEDTSVYTDVTWLPQGKVLALRHDERKRYGATSVCPTGAMQLQVFSEDMIYKLDITPSIGYAAYTGTNISASVDVDAYDASNSRLATTVRIEINGPAVWSNSTKYKDVTTSSSATTTENITITGDGQIEFKVVEIQSI